MDQALDESVDGRSMGHREAPHGLPCPEGGAVAVRNVFVAAPASRSSRSRPRHQKDCLIFYSKVASFTQSSSGLLSSVTQRESQLARTRKAVDYCVEDFTHFAAPSHLSRLAFCIWITRETLGVAVVPESALKEVGSGRTALNDLSAFVSEQGGLYKELHVLPVIEYEAHEIIGVLQVMVVVLPRLS